MYNKSIKEHVGHLKAVLEVLRQHQLYAKASNTPLDVGKCSTWAMLFPKRESKLIH